MEIKINYFNRNFQIFISENFRTNNFQDTLKIKNCENKHKKFSAVYVVYIFPDSFQR